MELLIVDDDAVSRRLLRTHLEKWGYRVTEAVDGEDAWERFQAGDFAIVITDWMMPRLDGLELIRRIRAERTPGQHRSYVYTMLLTARTNAADMILGMEAGADDFVSKPFDHEELRVRVRAGERIIVLERNLTERNEALDRARQELEQRVEARAVELAAAQDRLLEAEQERKRFYGEVIRAVTHDRLHLMDAVEIETPGREILDVALDGPEAYADLRRRLRATCFEAGMTPESGEDYVLAVGEATTNAIKHGTDGRCRVLLTDERIIARVSDCGPGMRAEDLPASVLTPGFSTALSLGMGYSLMLELVTRICLATSPDGTLVQLEKWLHPVETDDPEEALLAAFDRL